VNCEKAFPPCPDDRIHLHFGHVRILFFELKIILTIPADMAAFINFEFRLFITLTEFDLSWQINVPDIKEACIHIVVNSLFAAHELIFTFHIDLMY